MAERNDARKVGVWKPKHLDREPRKGLLEKDRSVRHQGEAAREVM